VTPVWLAAQPLVALRERNRLDTAVVDDVVMGCVVPVGEQGGNVGRMAVLQADYAQSVAGVQLNRYCGSGLEAVSFAAAKVMAGQADMTIGAGVEMMSRVPMGSDGGAWAQDPQLASKTYFVMQGISADCWHRCAATAAVIWMRTRPKAIAARPRPGRKVALTSLSCPSKTSWA
jgi:acetyl-CoA C-acetyltransferase